MPRSRAGGVLSARARSGSGATRRAQPEHGEHPPLALRFPEALGAKQAKGATADVGISPFFGEPERGLEIIFCRPKADPIYMVLARRLGEFNLSTRA